LNSNWDLHTLRGVIEHNLLVKNQLEGAVGLPSPKVARELLKLAQINRRIQLCDHEQARRIVFSALTGLEVFQVAFERILLPCATFQYQIKAEVSFDWVKAKLLLGGQELFLKLGFALVAWKQGAPDTDLVHLRANLKMHPSCHNSPWPLPLQVKRPSQKHLHRLH